MIFNFNTSNHDGLLTGFLVERNKEILDKYLTKSLIFTEKLKVKVDKKFTINNFVDTLSKVIHKDDYLVSDVLNSTSIYIKELVIKDSHTLENLYISVHIHTNYEYTSFCVECYSSCETLLNKVTDTINGILEPHSVNVDTTTINWYYLTKGSLDYAEIEDVLGETIHDSFYPWMNKSKDEFVNSYLQDKASVALYYGPPGSGKTTLIREICSHAPGTVYYTNDSKVMESGNFFMNFLTDTDSRILVLEDIDIHLTSRESGNSFMYQLLGTADGFIRNRKKKIIISSNIDNIDNVDKALLRDGRCWGHFRVGELTYKESKQVLIDLNKQHLIDDLCFSETYTLSKLFAMK